jgi:transposase
MVIERRRSRLRRGVQEELIKYFCMGVTARSAAQIAGVNRNTAILFYHKLREVIFAELEAETPELMRGEIEVDESYFGGHRKGKRGRGAAGKVAVFGLLKRQGKVHVVIIPDARSDTLIPIIRKKIRPDSIVYTDAFRSYDVLDVSEFRHLRINHSVLFADQHNHINGIENFWNQAKRHLRSYNGIAQHHFPLFIKECEWRFNYRPVSHMLQTLTRWWFK